MIKIISNLDLELRLVCRAARLIHKVIHGGRPAYLEVDQNHPQTELRARNAGLFEIRRNKKVDLHIFQVLTSGLWNKLPQMIRTEARTARLKMS